MVRLPPALGDVSLLFLAVFSCCIFLLHFLGALPYLSGI